MIAENAALLGQAHVQGVEVAAGVGRVVRRQRAIGAEARGFSPEPRLEPAGRNVSQLTPEHARSVAPEYRSPSSEIRNQRPEAEIQIAPRTASPERSPPQNEHAARMTEGGQETTPANRAVNRSISGSQAEVGRRQVEVSMLPSGVGRRPAVVRIRRSGRIISESTSADGTVLIRSEVGSPVSRRHFERQLLRGVLVGLRGWHRAHSQGAGTGAESRLGIFYAPPKVNSELQRHGIEEHIREVFEIANSTGHNLFQVTETRPHPETRRLASITYRLEAQGRDGRAHILYEVEIEVQNKRDNPRISIRTALAGQWDAQ